MIYPEKEVILKNGRTALFRSPKEEDARELVDFLKAVTAESPFLLRTLEECTMTEAQEAAWIQNARSSQNTAVIICEVDGKLAGTCEINFFTRVKLRHRAAIAISLRKEFWNLGIGTLMFEELIHMAEERPGVTHLRLEVMEGNVRAIHLYEKMGFQIVAVRPNAFCLEDGTMRKELIMVKEMCVG